MLCTSDVTHQPLCLGMKKGTSVPELAGYHSYATVLHVQWAVRVGGTVLLA
jgi:hypothetical protein